MMTSNLRTLLVGAAAALGLASTAALAQQADALPQTENARMMGKGQIANGGMMMGDSEMRGEMMTMMKNCNKMMARMDATSSPKKAPRQPHEKRSPVLGQSADYGTQRCQVKSEERRG